MTNAELIQKIRAEIERLIEESDFDESANLYSLLSFLSDLEESERPEPYNPVYDEAYLNEKIKKATESWKGVDVDAMLAECRGYDEEESEKPMNLVERIGSYNIVPYIDDKIAKLQDMWREEKVAFDWDDMHEMIEDVARHFAQWGAEHSKK